MSRMGTVERFFICAAVEVAVGVAMLAALSAYVLSQRPVAPQPAPPHQTYECYAPREIAPWTGPRVPCGWIPEKRDV